MNMKLKRILSSALVVIMLFSAIAVLLPVQAQAAHYSSTSVSSDRLSDDAVKKIVENYSNSAYSSAEEMFLADLEGDPDVEGDTYLDYATNGTYSIYVNRYTGVMYYRNELTKEMLTSNPYKLKGVGGSEEFMSQVSVVFSTVSNTGVTETYQSYTWAALKNQISVTKIDNGLRVSYAIGETATRCLIPIEITAEEFEKDILGPMFETLYEKMCENLGEEYAIRYFGSDSDYYDEEKVYADRLLHTTSISAYSNDFSTKIAQYKAATPGANKDVEIVSKIAEVTRIMDAIKIVLYAYQPYNPAHSSFKYDETTHPQITAEGVAAYKLKDTDFSQMASKAKYIKNYCPDYTFEMMYEDEELCGYTHVNELQPVFRCSLEYTFNEDGSLSVRLPSNSIVFDETEYILKSITPLQHFGAASFAQDGYIFLPDGSGSIIEFEDFRGGNIAMSSSLTFYGSDYCYSEISGAHKQPLTMPVYGIASQTENSSFGYFAILEEGSSMASLNIKYRYSTFDEGSVYTTFTPYPSDKFDLSDTISVGGTQFYTKVSESKYSGSYVTRYVMLSDKSDYAASYVGMASYYRDYLVKNGTLTELENVSDDLPLYLEALGSIEIVEKILTFPVNVSKPITTFEDIITMYEDLGNAKQKLLDKAAEYDALAEAEEDNNDLRESYMETAENYRRLSEEIVNIDNINFKLTGFTNGGLTSTYPTRVKWERVLGGKSGFKALLKTADEYTDDDSNFGVYPDFDFQYISYTSLFDGVGKRNTVSRMVDNRYASKQVYNSVTREFETVYAMIVSADALDRLYDKFIKKYDNYDAVGISVSTLGSDLNSNFDKKNPVSRDEAQGYVSDLLDRIANESEYSVMTSQGNIYAVKYADHILNVCTDSSYYRFSSYTVPFIGMVLHGYVNYAGAALNYSGSPDYDLLRSIENGASIYYVVGYQNSDLMKDDEEFNKYYSVSYENWFDDIVEKYALLNAQIGDIQDFKIVNHEVLIGERVIDSDEQAANLEALKNEFIDNFRAELEAKIDAKLYDLRMAGDVTTKIAVDADIDALVAIAHEMFELDADENLPASFNDSLASVLASFQEEFTYAPGDQTASVYVDSLNYESKYQYVTGSTARDDDYDYTDYTVDNDFIVMVTYRHEDGRTRSFILNYNIYSVEVTLENGESYVVEKYSFARIDG